MSGMLSSLFNGANKTKLMEFLQSPQALGLASGLLANPTPYLSGGLALGFGNMGKAKQFEMEHGLEKDKLKQQDALERARLAISQGHLDLDREKLYNPRAQALTGLAAEAASLNRVLLDPTIDPEIKKGLIKDFENRRKVQESLYGTRQKNMEVKDFQLLPADSKINVLSQYAGVGINEKDAVSLFNKGISPDMYLEYQQAAPGADPDSLPDMTPQIDSAGSIKANEPVMPKIRPVSGQVDKIYPATSATRTSIQTAEGALSEEEWIAPIITDAMAPYSRKFAGYSPKQMVDALSGDSQKIDKVAKFYAARALQPEIAGIRSRMTAGSSAHEALKEIQSAALNKIKVLESEVSEEAYSKAQNYISEWIGGMTRARVNAMKGVKTNQSSPAPSSAASSSSVMQNDDPLGLKKRKKK